MAETSKTDGALALGIPSKPICGTQPCEFCLPLQ